MKNYEIIDNYISHGLSNGVEPRDVIMALRDKPENLMSKADYESYLKLPDEVTVYRGCSMDEIDENDGPLGISWSLDYKVAEFFAARSINGCVIKATVPKEVIKVVHMSRHEAEVMLLPFVDYDIVTDSIPDDYDFEAFHEYAKTI